MPAEEAASAFTCAVGPNQLRPGGAACLLGATGALVLSGGARCRGSD